MNDQIIGLLASRLFLLDYASCCVYISSQNPDLISPLFCPGILCGNLLPSGSSPHAVTWHSKPCEIKLQPTFSSFFLTTPHWVPLILVTAPPPKHFMLVFLPSCLFSGYSCCLRFPPLPALILIQSWQRGLSSEPATHVKWKPDTKRGHYEWFHLYEDQK